MNQATYNFIKPSVSREIMSVVVYGCTSGIGYVASDLLSMNTIQVSSGRVYNSSTSIVSSSGSNEHFRMYVTHRTHNMLIGFTDDDIPKFTILRYPSLSTFSSSTYSNITYTQWIKDIKDEADQNDIFVEKCTNEFDVPWRINVR